MKEIRFYFRLGYILLAVSFKIYKIILLKICLLFRVHNILKYLLFIILNYYNFNFLFVYR